jgi:hypothetical protein
MLVPFKFVIYMLAFTHLSLRDDKISLVTKKIDISK